MAKNPYEELAFAVILTAVNDYRDARSRLARGRKSTDAERMKSDCERFFVSDTFAMYSDMDGRALLKKLAEEEQ